jgi:hypothetical protein
MHDLAATWIPIHGSPVRPVTSGDEAQMEFLFQIVACFRQAADEVHASWPNISLASCQMRIRPKRLRPGRQGLRAFP